MLAVRHRPELATQELMDWLRPQIRYDAEGRFSMWLNHGELQPQLAVIAEAVCPGVKFSGVVLQAYQHGLAVTPCHSDRRATGFCFILSLGSPRRFRVHRTDQACDAPDLDAIWIECPSGTLLIMDEDFQNHWHHQVVSDPNVTGEKLSLVFRTQPTGDN